MILFIRQERIPYHETTSNLTSAKTGREQHVQLVLYKVVNSMFTQDTTGKKSIAKFFDLNNDQEIPKKMWTEEMHRFAEKEIKNYPVPNPGTKFTNAGKIFFTFSALLFLAIGGYLFYALVFQAPQTKKARAEFLEIPETGDKYYGSVFGEEYRDGGLKHAWGIVKSVNTAERTAELQLSKEVSGENSFEPMKHDHENFTGKTYQVKYKIDEEKSDVDFHEINGDFSLESSVISGEYSQYKIPANP